MIDLKLPSKKLPVEPFLKILSQEELTLIGPKGIQEWIDRGISFRDADKVAVKHGYHPVEIWGNLWNTADVHEDLYNAGVSVVEAVKKFGSISMQELFNQVDVPGDYIRDILKWVEELGCIRMELVGPKRKKMYYFERDFDA